MNLHAGTCNGSNKKVFARELTAELEQESNQKRPQNRMLMLRHADAKFSPLSKKSSAIRLLINRIRRR